MVRARSVISAATSSKLVIDFSASAGLADRTWVLLTDTYDGGWGIAGHANTNEEIVALARAELSR
jgi:hypothetical protein